MQLLLVEGLLLLCHAGVGVQITIILEVLLDQVFGLLVGQQSIDHDCLLLSIQVLVVDVIGHIGCGAGADTEAHAQRKSKSQRTNHFLHVIKVLSNVGWLAMRDRWRKYGPDRPCTQRCNRTGCP